MGQSNAPSNILGVKVILALCLGIASILCNEIEVSSL